MRVIGRLLALFAAAAPASAGPATEYIIDPAQSVFAVVVHKAGIAARLAHNHLIYPEQYTAKLSVDGPDATTAAFDLEFPVSKLQVDAPEAHAKWYPGIEKAGILDKPFSDLDDDDRKTVAEHMLAKDQLDAAQYPNISAKITKVRAEASTHGGQTYTHAVTIAFSVHGKTVEKDCPASIVIEGEGATVDAMGAFTFSEFGIKPYSALMGAVRNTDEFHVFVHVAAKAKL
jgi:polyisoprenoid-binding protein YceI